MEDSQSLNEHPSSLDEFSLIKHFLADFSNNLPGNADLQDLEIQKGIGDDAACLRINPEQDLLISTDSMLEGVHFCSDWSAEDLAYKSVMTNITDILAMGGKPRWITLALSLPKADPVWLKNFTDGLKEALRTYGISLIGGNTTKGPLSITISILGTIENGRAVYRSGAKLGDKIYLSGCLGAAALAIELSKQKKEGKKAEIIDSDEKILTRALKRPQPQLLFSKIISTYASAAIDLSDGFIADLNHICEQSKVGAKLYESKIPIHNLVKQYAAATINNRSSLDFALYGGDDYELCFTIPAQFEEEFLLALKKEDLHCFFCGEISSNPGIFLQSLSGEESLLQIRGYQHF